MPFSYVFLTSLLSHPGKLAALQIRAVIHFSLYGVGNGSHPVAELTEISMDSRISFSSVIQIEEEYWDKFISSFCGNMGRKSDRLYCITFDYISFSGC